MLFNAILKPPAYQASKYGTNKKGTFEVKKVAYTLNSERKVWTLIKVISFGHKQLSPLENSTLLFIIIALFEVTSIS